MRIALVSEGAYPIVTGGVSTWCDQLVRGMPEHEWTVVGVTATGTERPVWAMPSSVSSVILQGLWGAGPPPARRPWRGPDPRVAAELALERLWTAALAPDDDHAVDEAEAALRRLVELSTTTRLGSLLAAAGSTAALLRAWRLQCPDLPQMTVAQAVTASRLVDRTLAVVDTPLPPVDLVHAAGNGTAALIGLAAHWRHGTPMVLSEHGVYLRERYLALAKEGFSWVERRAVTALMRRLCEVAYRVAARILPVSDFNRRWILRLGADPSRVVTIHNGVQPELYPPVGDEPGTPTLSFVGRIDPLKDLHTLVRAFALVRTELPSARLRLFGPVPEGNEAYRDSVTHLVTELGLGDAVTFEGPSAGSRPAIEAGTVVVLSSISEGMPFTVIEAMMCGRATVSTDVGGVIECLDPEQRAGLVVPARDPRAFADACLELLTRDARRRDMAEAARRHALAEGTLERTLAAYREQYLSAARRPDPEEEPLNIVADINGLVPSPRDLLMGASR
jgi:glycosyltransferase involved in cell wall biosynthesis